MSDYFRDSYQGVGAIAAAAPAPRSAPGANVRAFGRPHPPTRSCPPAMIGMERCGPGSRRVCYCRRASALGAMDLRTGGDGDGGGGGGGGDGGGGTGGGSTSSGTRRLPIKLLAPRRPPVKLLAPPSRQPPAQFQPPKPWPSIFTPFPSKPPTQAMPNLNAAVTATTTLPPGTTSGGLPAPIKTQTVGWGGGGGGGGGGGMEELAPEDRDDGVQASAMTGGLPAGAAKIWLVVGAAGVAFLALRSKKKRHRR